MEYHLRVLLEKSCEGYNFDILVSMFMKKAKQGFSICYVLFLVSSYVHILHGGNFAAHCMGLLLALHYKHWLEFERAANMKHS